MALRIEDYLDAALLLVPQTGFLPWDDDRVVGTVKAVERELYRDGEAREVFERLLDLRNNVGLLSEEYDPGIRRQVGNTPQAYSHVGLINTARHLSETRPKKTGHHADKKEK